MNRSFRLFLGNIIFVWCGFNLSLAAEPDAASKYLSKRSVEIEWDEVPGATQYDLEIYDGKNKKFIKTFTSKTNVFKLNIKMGKYFFRSRILDKFERSSEWTDMAELVIAPPPTKITTKIPESPQLFADKNTGLVNFPLTWEALPGITEYKVMLESPEGKLEKEISVQSNTTILQVPPGQHQFRVKAVLADGTLGDASAPTTSISVLGAKIQKPIVRFKKDEKKIQRVLFSSELATAQFDGEIFYQALEGTEWKKVKEFRDSKTHEIIFDTSYIPGRYQVKVKAIAKGFTPSELGETEFIIKPTELVIINIPTETLTATQEPPVPNP